jgi:hypothetical protein
MPVVAAVLAATAAAALLLVSARSSFTLPALFFLVAANRSFDSRDDLAIKRGRRFE